MKDVGEAERHDGALNGLGATKREGWRAITDERRSKDPELDKTSDVCGADFDALPCPSRLCRNDSKEEVMMRVGERTRFFFPLVHFTIHDGSLSAVISCRADRPDVTPLIFTAVVLQV